MGQGKWIMDRTPKINGAIYSCWKITGNFNYSIESCANQKQDGCPDLEPYRKCPMGHQVLF